MTGPEHGGPLRRASGRRLMHTVLPPSSRRKRGKRYPLGSGWHCHAFGRLLFTRCATGHRYALASGGCSSGSAWHCHAFGRLLFTRCASGHRYALASRGCSSGSAWRCHAFGLTFISPGADVIWHVESPFHRNAKVRAQTVLARISMEQVRLTSSSLKCRFSGDLSVIRIGALIKNPAQRLLASRGLKFRAFSTSKSKVRLRRMSISAPIRRIESTRFPSRLNHSNRPIVS